MEHRKNFGARINRQPDPEHLGVATQPCSQFIQLHVRKLEVAERVFV
jgi:hypothetical protein